MERACRAARKNEIRVETAVHPEIQNKSKQTGRLENITHIIQACARKNPKSQKWVYERYFGFALKIVFRYIYRYDKAVDVTNDGFVKLFLSFSRFTPGVAADTEKMLMGYIRRIMINCAIDEWRSNKMLPEIGGIPDHAWDLSSRTDDADQMALYKELAELVKKLPPQYRIVFNMYVMDGYNHLEIADTMKISVGTSRSCLSRARAMLQKSIKNLEEAKVCSI